MRYLPAVLATLTLAAIAGCGFHLRGHVPLPGAFSATYIETTDPYSPLYQALTRRLRDAGATLAGNPAEASAVIHVLSDDTGRELLSVTTDNKPGEYEVYYRVTYSVSADGEELLPRQELARTRDYGYDETAVLAKEHEERALRVALADELASLMIRRLAAL